MTALQIHADPIGTASGSIAVRPVVLAAPERGDDIEVRVTAPTTGHALPIVVFSHGFGFSMDGYGPLADFWASHGFVVLQPTHLDSAELGLALDDPRGPDIWRYRITDLVTVLDHLDHLIDALPGLAGRVDTDRLAVAGHSYGATTASALLGARVLAPAGDPNESFTDSRVSAGVLLCLAGAAGDELTPMAQQMFPFMSPNFESLSTPALFVAGDADQSVLSTRGPDWWADGYHQSPGDKSLLTLHGAEHSLGGIHAHGGVPHTPDENPATVTHVQRMTTAYLRTALGVDPASWAVARRDFGLDAKDGRLESRSDD